MDSATHTEHEDHGWDINIPNHPPRTDSEEYVKSRHTMNEMARGVEGFYYGAAPYQDHHGGGLWLKDGDGWFLVRNLAGLEWSSQFAADPAKVDLLRQNARRVYALSPESVDELGIRELLDTPITDAEGVARWTDSICNASVALEPKLHTGVLPHGAGVHHYPAPIVEIQTFVRDDFQLFVTDAEGKPAVVAPMAPRGSGDARVRVLYATPGTKLHEAHQAKAAACEELVLDEGHPLAQQAFAQQSGQPLVLDSGQLGSGDRLA